MDSARTRGGKRSMLAPLYSVRSQCQAVTGFDPGSSNRFMLQHYRTVFLKEREQVLILRDAKLMDRVLQDGLYLLMRFNDERSRHTIVDDENLEFVFNSCYFHICSSMKVVAIRL